MFCRTKDSAPVLFRIMPARPPKNAAVMALASFTPSGMTLCLCTRSSRNCTAPSVEGSS